MHPTGLALLVLAGLAVGSYNVGCRYLTQVGATAALVNSAAMLSIGLVAIGTLAATAAATGTAKVEAKAAAAAATGARAQKAPSTSSTCLDLGWGKAYVRSQGSFVGQAGASCDTPFGRGALKSGSVDTSGVCEVELPCGATAHVRSRHVALVY